MDKISIKNLVPETKIGDSKSSILDINSMITINNCADDVAQGYWKSFLTNAL